MEGERSSLLGKIFCFDLGFFSYPGSVSLMTTVYTVTSDLTTASNRAKTCRVGQ